MAEVAPIPKASVMSEAAAKPGLLISPRTAWVTSCRIPSNMRCLTARMGAGLAETASKRRVKGSDPVTISIAHENRGWTIAVVARPRADQPAFADPPDHE